MNSRPQNDRFRQVRLLNLLWVIPVAYIVAQIFLYIGLLGYCAEGVSRCNTQNPLLFAKNVLFLLVPFMIGSVLSGAVITLSPWSRRWAFRRRVGTATGTLVMMIYLVIAILR